MWTKKTNDFGRGKIALINRRYEMDDETFQKFKKTPMEIKDFDGKMFTLIDKNTGETVKCLRKNFIIPRMDNLLEIEKWREKSEKTKKCPDEKARASHTKSQRKYDKNHCTGIYLKLNNFRDYDLIEWLNMQENKQGAIKHLIQIQIMIEQEKLQLIPGKNATF